MALDLEVPDHTTISRRSQHLDVGLRLAATKGRLHLIVDSTGLSIVGEGEWAAAMVVAANVPGRSFISVSIGLV
jgi:hypothetical protein